MAEVYWKGLKASEKLCELLPERIAKSKIREIYKYALQPTKDRMQSNVGKTGTTGRLWYSIDTTIIGSSFNTMYGIVGPRRSRNTWNQQGRHAYAVEVGTSAHTITVKNAKAMPVYSGGRVAGFVKTMKHKGSAAKYPFRRGITSTIIQVAQRTTKKFGEVINREIDNITKQFGGI